MKIQAFHLNISIIIHAYFQLNQKLIIIKRICALGHIIQKALIIADRTRCRGFAKINLSGICRPDPRENPIMPDQPHPMPAFARYDR